MCLQQAAHSCLWECRGCMDTDACPSFTVTWVSDPERVQCSSPALATMSMQPLCPPPHDVLHVTSRSVTRREDQQHSLISLPSAQWHLPSLSQIHRWACRQTWWVCHLWGCVWKSAQPPDCFHLTVRLSDFTHSRRLQLPGGCKKNSKSPQKGLK